MYCAKFVTSNVVLNPFFSINIRVMTHKCYLADRISPSGDNGLTLMWLLNWHHMTSSKSPNLPTPIDGEMQGVCLLTLFTGRSGAQALPLPQDMPRTKLLHH
ncbi:unnamed protein product, partial [Owenia fusiformis]